MVESEELRFDVNGHVIAALAYGDPDAPVVLGLHGWLDNAATFNQLAPLLKGVRFIALDLMGHGYSDHRPPSMPYYIWDNVVDVVAVADELGLEELHLLGHSMGASIASLLAGAFPERVQRVWLIEGVAPLVYGAEQLPALMAEAINKRGKLKAKKLRPYAHLDDAVKARVNGRFPVSEQAARWLVSRGMVRGGDGLYWRNDPSLVLPSILRMSEDQVQSFLRKITAQVDLILGKDGLDLDALEERSACIRHLETHYFPGNHHLHLESEAAALIAPLINNYFEEMLESDQV